MVDVTLYGEKVRPMEEHLYRVNMNTQAEVHQNC